MSGQRSIRDSLNKAYRKVRPTREEMDSLRDGLVKMLGDSNPVESEEYHKTLLRDFLNKHAFGEYFINTKGRSDLVIYNGRTAGAEVGVLIETKGPGNIAEMPRIDNLNKKAMQELLLYYLRERVSNRNIELKHLIATNLQEWFFFDASEFEKIAENAKLKKHYKEFVDGRLLDEKTGFFYKEIASPVLEEVKDSIKFTYFNIEDYTKHLRRQTKTDDRKLIELQKILSPIHLLKLQFANDSNTLNKEFYNELLHIMGLEEYREKSKKLIRRKLKENRNEDSLIEATITQLVSLDKLPRIKQVERFGSSADDRLFNVALDLKQAYLDCFVGC